MHKLTMIKQSELHPDPEQCKSFLRIFLISYLLLFAANV